MDQNIFSAHGSNVHVSKLVFSKFKKLYQDNLLDKKHAEVLPLNLVSGLLLNSHSEFVSPKCKTDEADIENKQLIANSSLPKRKFEETEKYKNEFQNTFPSKFPKISDSSYPKEENYWKQYKNLIPYSVKSYVSLLPSMHHEGNLLPEGLPFSILTSVVSLSKHIDQGKANSTHTEEIFTTAAGKNISISDAAMMAAKKLTQSVFQDETYQKIDRSIDCFSVKNKPFIKSLPSMKKNCVISYPTRSDKDDEITTKEIDSKRMNSNQDLVVNYDTDNVSFSTAAGKTVDVSEAAMKAAHKLIESVFENEDKIMPSASSTYNLSKKNSTFKDIGCPPKKLQTEDDDTMDKALLEKFFQDDVFSDMKESQEATESSNVKDCDKVIELKINNDSKTRKIRKSLGGRRNMRFYPHT